MERRKQRKIISSLSKNRVGNGGFSLRSKEFLNYSSKFNDCLSYAEDVFLCLVNYEEAINNKIKFAPFEIALKFSYEVPLGGFKKNKEKKIGHLIKIIILAGMVKDFQIMKIF